MHSLQIHKVINQLISFCYRIGFWYQGDEATVKEFRMKLFYSIYYALFFISLVVGAITHDNKDESIFLAEVSIIIAVLTVKLWFLIWKQNQILELLNRICVFSIRSDNDFDFVNKKLSRFIRFVSALLLITIGAGACEITFIPFIGSEKTLFLKIAFPLDWKNNEISFWITYIFLASEIFFTLTAIIFSIIIWYLMLNCSLRYVVLGNELRKMGQRADEGGIIFSEKEKLELFLQDLKAAIISHVHIMKLVDHLGSFCSNLFFLQFCTSAVCISGSIYSLVYDIGDNLIERIVYLSTLFYNIAEIFMISYFGNEIMLSSNRLSYSLFESDWIIQKESTKKHIIIFGEYLKKPHELVVGKLYPLSLEIFTRILNSAYSIFNILKNTKH